MSDPRRIPGSSETIQTSRPSWGPAFLAVGAIGAVAGIYANGFVFSAFVWSYIGIVIMLFAFRAIVRSSVRSYFSLPRRQEALRAGSRGRRVPPTAPDGTLSLRAAA